MHRLLMLVVLLMPALASAQSSLQYSVLVEAVASESPLQIKLTWDNDPNASSYAVYRKPIGSNAWGAPLQVSTDTSYIDSDIQTAIPYEYRVFKNATGSGYTANGYALAGVNYRRDEADMRVLLLVSDTIAAALPNEIQMTMDDLRDEGYRPEMLVVSEDTTAAFVKNHIEALLTVDSSVLGMIYIVGHVPVPYSGNLAPDGHTNNHLGAWPADVFYADIDGIWTDNAVNNSSASGTRNDNVPGDGKYDQSVVPGNGMPEIAIGRVDFDRLPGFGEDEIELTRRYLQRVHAYKRGEWTLPKRGLVDDHFGGFGGEAFATNGWRNFAPLVGMHQIDALDYRSTLNTEGYLFSYGCGGGSFTSASGIGTSAQLASDSLLTGFTMLFGSYFGDWDSPDNFMRSALAQGTTMSIAWAGRPWWYFHRMGLGMNLGESAFLTQGNNATFHSSYGAQFVHVALLGDPSLRMEYLVPPTSLVVDSIDTFHVALSWQASSSLSIDGYDIFRRSNGAGWGRLNDAPVVGNTYIDSCALEATVYEYRVVSTKLQEGFSGSYHLQSLAAYGSVEFQTDRNINEEVLVSYSGPTVILHAGNEYSKLTWNVGGTQSSEHSYLISLGNVFGGIDTVIHYSVTIQNSCESIEITDSVHVVIAVGVKVVKPSSVITLYPNPMRSGSQQLRIQPSIEGSSRFECYSILGQLIEMGLVEGGKIHFERPLNPGEYILRIEHDQPSVHRLVVIQ